MSVSPSGFALRSNGTCPANQVDCGTTVSPYHVCCPPASFCPTQYSINCCPTSANCTITLLQNPQCANQSWDLYENGGFFCCEQGYAGYAATTDSDGCAQPGYAFSSGERLLNLISTGQGTVFLDIASDNCGRADGCHSVAVTASESSTSPSVTPSLPPSSSTISSFNPTVPPSGSSASTSSTLDFTPSSTPTLPSNTPTKTPTPKKSNTRVVVGGVLGSVLGVMLLAFAIWTFLSRKRPKGKQEQAVAASAKVQPGHEMDGTAVPELFAEHGVSEAPGTREIIELS